MPASVGVAGGHPIAFCDHVVKSVCGDELAEAFASGSQDLWHLAVAW